MSQDTNPADGTSVRGGDEGLNKFLEDAHHNGEAAQVNFRDQYELLVAIDDQYRKVIRNLGMSPELIAGFFLFRTHSAFRGAVRLALSGQLAESYMVLRGCLESALYGLFVVGSSERQEIWLQRHADDESARRVKSTFTIRNVMDHLRGIDANTHRISEVLYNMTIDMGGHSNERAVNAQIKVESSGPRIEVTAESFVLGDIRHRVTLKVVAQVGICCLDIFSHAFGDQYRMLGIIGRLNSLRVGL